MRSGSSGEAVDRLAVRSRLLARRRRNRFGLVVRRVQVHPELRVLDVGCGPDGRSVSDWAPPTWSIVGIDLYAASEVRHAHPGFRYLQGDAADLSMFEDGAFDLVFCMGLLEHVCDRRRLEAIAAELIRVARQQIVVVPWRFAVVEPHFKWPGFQLLPRRVQNRLVTALDLHGRRQAVEHDPDYIERHYQWLPTSEWVALFPGSRAVVLPSLDTVAIIRSLRPR